MGSLKLGLTAPSRGRDFDLASSRLKLSLTAIRDCVLQVLLIELLCRLPVFIHFIYLFIPMNPRPPPRVRYFIHLSSFSFQTYLSNSNHPPCQS